MIALLHLLQQLIPGLREGEDSGQDVLKRAAERESALTCSGFQLVKEKSCREGQMEHFSWERCSPAGRSSRRSRR